MKRSVHLVDDNAEFRESASFWLSSIGYEVLEFDDPQRYLDFVRTSDGDGHVCVLLDVRMPKLSGLQVHDALRALGLAWPIVYMTGHGDVPLAVQAMQKGAVTFLEKPFRDAALESALSAAFAAPASAPARTQPADEPAPSSQGLEFDRRLARLTLRERQVLQHVIDGKLNKQIADQLSISIKTVELHRSRVMSKMQAKSLTQLIKMMMRHEVEA